MDNRAVVVRPSAVILSGGDQRIPAFEVLLAGDFADPAQEVVIKEAASDTWNTHDQSGRQLGTVSGDWSPIDCDSHHFELLKPTASPQMAAPDIFNPLEHPVVAFAFRTGATDAADFLYFALPDDKFHKCGPDSILGRFEGDCWDLQVQAGGGSVKSPVFRVLWNPRAVPSRFQMGRGAAYDWHPLNDLKFYNDACAGPDGKGSYFEDLIAAIGKAKSFIFIVDWSFHSSVFLSPGDYTAANTVGALLIKKAQAGVLVVILTWIHGSTPEDTPNDSCLRVLLDIQAAMDAAAVPVFTLGEPPPDQPDQPDEPDAFDNILWRGDYRTLTRSHHQKFVVLDNGEGRSELVAFYGGIDITRGRFDWGAHPVMRSEATRHFWSTATFGDTTYNEWYNAEFEAYGSDLPKDTVYPRQPWHDNHARLQGPIAWDFAREFVTRWRKVTGSSRGSKDAAGISKVLDKFKSLFDRGKFVQQWEQRQAPADRPWSGQLLHSIDKAHWSDEWVNEAWSSHRNESEWKVGLGFERSIQDSYLRAIHRAERFVYIENQYFIGSGDRWPGPVARPSVANRIPEALVQRVQWMIKNHPGRDFHVFVLLPMAPEGPMVPEKYNVNPGIRALEWRTMAYMISEVRDASASIGKKWEDYLSFCFLMRSDAPGELGAPEHVTHGLTRLSVLRRMRTNLAQSNRRYMIYIHCKLMIVDDRYLILGSANANERSMAGNRDTEIGVALWPSSNQVAPACEATIRDLRGRLVQEHMGSRPPGWEKPESVAFRSGQFQALARSNYKQLFLRASTAAGGGQMQGHVVMLPIDVAADRDSRQAPDWFNAAERGDATHTYIIDSLRNHGQWMWRSDVNTVVGGGLASELIE